MKLVNQKVYVVKWGDTLTKIAKHFCTEKSQLYKVAEDNGIINPSLIYPGMRIWIREEFLKEEFKSQKTDLKNGSLKEEEIIQFTPGGVLFKPKFWRSSLPNGYFRIRSVVTQERIVVEDYNGRLYYFHLNDRQELIQIMGAIEIIPGHFMVIGTPIIVPQEYL